MTQSQSPDENYREPEAGPELAYVLSMVVSSQTRAKWGHCYENIYPAFFAYPPLFYPFGRFVEGFVVFIDEDSNQVVLMEHGWLVDNESQIIDPTLVIVLMPFQPVFYFPGVTRSWSELRVLENELFPYVQQSGYGDDGMEHPAYKAAYEAAREKAQSLVSEHYLFKEVRAKLLSKEEEELLNETPGITVIVFQEGE